MTAAPTGPSTRRAYSFWKTPVGVEPRASGLEAVPLRIAGRQRRGLLEVALAPVRAALVVVHDRLDRAEVRLPHHAAVHVHGDVDGVALVGGAQVGVVARDHPELDRERHGEAAPLDHVEHAAQRLRAVGARDRVLHLGEAHAAAWWRRPCGCDRSSRSRRAPRTISAVDPRDRARGSACRSGRTSAKRVVLQQRLRARTPRRGRAARAGRRRAWSRGTARRRVCGNT